MNKDKTIRIPPELSDRARAVLVDRLTGYRKARLVDSLITRKVQTIYIPGAIMDEIEELFDRDLNPV